MHTYARGCTCIGWHLKERFLQGTITWSEMGKQSIQDRKVYCFCPFSFRLHRSLALSSIAIFVVKRLLTMWAPITSAIFFLLDSEESDTRERASARESRHPRGEFSFFPPGAPFLTPIWGQLIYNIEYFKCRPNEAIVLFYNFLLQSRTQCYSIYTKLN